MKTDEVTDMVMWQRPTVPSLFVTMTLLSGCVSPAEQSETADATVALAEVEAAVWAFHAADTAKDAEAVIRLLWPEYTMFADGSPVAYDDVVAGSREFMAGLDLFHTEWTDLRTTALGPDAVLSSFLFRDSIVTTAGDLIQARGQTTFVWQRRGGEWRILFGHADHYPIEP